MLSALEHCILNSAQYELSMDWVPSISDYNTVYPIECIVHGFLWFPS